VTKTSQILEAWNCEVAKALSSFGDGERLAGAISRMIRAVVPCEFTHMSVWDDRGRWLEVHQHPADFELPQPPFPEVFYELDPFALAYREGRSGSLSLREMAPVGFERSAYYQQYYLDEGYSDALVHLARLPEGITAWTELGRGPAREGFTRAECELHEAMFPAVEAFSARVADLMWGAGEHLPNPYAGDLETALEGFGADCLTEREHAVIQLVLRGHNTRSIASTLEIALETVKLHRKHAYAKLGVNSQGELFYQFLRSLESRPLQRPA
jgi:DNA-binding CsgD family transcriptional regulator